MSQLATRWPVPAATAPRTTPDLPAWPVLTLLWGFPLWWAAGATVIVGGLLAVIMVAYLVVGRRLPVVPGSMALAAFVLWVVPCGLMIDSGDRLIGYFYRSAILVIVAVVFFYAVCAGRALTRGRVIDALTLVWFFTIVGGIAGMLIPEVRLSTPVGALLPSHLRGNDYVQDLFFPPMAEVQRPYGSPETFVRPSAPFPYANSWGVAIVLLSPVAAACFARHRSWLLRLAILVGFGAMLPPAIATGNRGMFGVLVICALYVAVRLALRNRAAPVLFVGIVSVAATVFVVASGLLEQVALRQQYGDSTGTRLSLYGETIERTLRSPLLGYGAPRPSALHDVSVGTQGYVWMLMFSYGFVGLLLFVAFLWGTTLRTVRVIDDVDVMLHAVLVAASGAIVVYGLDIMQLLTIVLVAAVLLRRRHGLVPVDD